MKKEYNLVLDINRYLIKCKNDRHQTKLIRKYLEHKLGRLALANKRKPKYFLLLGIPINLLSF